MCRPEREGKCEKLGCVDSTPVYGHCPMILDIVMAQLASPADHAEGVGVNGTLAPSVAEVA